MHLSSAWRLTRLTVILGSVTVFSVGAAAKSSLSNRTVPKADPQNEFASFAQPLIGKYCLVATPPRSKRANSIWSNFDRSTSLLRT